MILGLLACLATEPPAQTELSTTEEPALFLAPASSTLMAGGDLRWVLSTWPELSPVDEVGLGELKPVGLVGGRRGLVAILPGGELEDIRGSSRLELAKVSEDRVNLALPEGGRVQARYHEGFLLLGDLSQVQRMVEPESLLPDPAGELPAGSSWVLIRHPRRALDEAASRLAREGKGQQLQAFRQDSGWTLAGLERIAIARDGDTLQLRIHCQGGPCEGEHLRKARLARQALLLADLPAEARPLLEGLHMRRVEDHIEGWAPWPE